MTWPHQEHFFIDSGEVHFRDSRIQAEPRLGCDNGEPQPGEARPGVPSRPPPSQEPRSFLLTPGVFLTRDPPGQKVIIHRSRASFYLSDFIVIHFLCVAVPHGTRIVSWGLLIFWRHSTATRRSPLRYRAVQRARAAIYIVFSAGYRVNSCCNAQAFIPGSFTGASPDTFLSPSHPLGLIFVGQRTRDCTHTDAGGAASDGGPWA